MSINVGEYGLAYRLNVSYDMSSNTSLSFEFVRPDKSVIVRDGVLGTAALVTEEYGTFPANQYASYVFADGDLTLPGKYTARLIYNSPGKRLKSDIDGFMVLP